MACAAIAGGADGLMIETHYDPAQSPVDSQQMITPDELTEVIAACRKLHKLIASAAK
jgi:3-deoxy-7-phosphoheptulonate synthase